MRLAAIDIGSNAIRLLIEEVISNDDETIVRKISLTRVPLRLGADTFTIGRISTKRINQLVRTMEAFWNLMDVHDVVDFRACATSAMREAENGEQVAEIVKNRANISIDIIDGQEEANLLFSNFKDRRIKEEESYLYIDLGGGSTEITVIKGGKKLIAKSFKIGTVRGLQGGISEETWNGLYSWIDDNKLGDMSLMGIGTGGNINRLHKESGLKSYENISIEDLANIHEYLSSFSLEERMIKLRLKPDRADVIVPAAAIYLNIMKRASVKEMIVPKVGLSDGIILELFSKWDNVKGKWKD